MASQLSRTGSSLVSKWFKTTVPLSKPSLSTPRFPNKAADTGLLTGDKLDGTTITVEVDGSQVLPLYLDTLGTTRPVVLKATLSKYWTSLYENPHSKTHAFGCENDRVAERGCKAGADIIGANPKESIFTAGATEGNNVGINGVAHFYKSNTSHTTAQPDQRWLLESYWSLKREGFKVTYLPVRTTGTGIINKEDLSVSSAPTRVPITVPHGTLIQPFVTPNPTTVPEWIDDSLSRPEMTEHSHVLNIKKEAARLVVIRRIKMNKHKLKKLRKRMKYVYAKVRLRRQIRYEKDFLNTQMARIREAQSFDAKAYVADILRRAKAEPLPTHWDGKYFPEPMIRDKMEIDAKRKRQEYLSILDKRSTSSGTE